MINLFSGLRSQLKELREKLKKHDPAKNPKVYKEILDALEAGEARYEKEKAKREEKRKAKEQKAQEVDKEAAPKVEDGNVVMPKKEFVEEHEKLVKELEPMVEEHKEQGAELKEVKEASPKCAICGTDFKSYPEYRKHQEEVHGAAKEYTPMDLAQKKEVVKNVEQKLGPAIIGSEEPKAELYKYSLDEKVQPARGEKSVGRVMRHDDNNPATLVYVYWDEGPLAERDHFGGYYQSDLKKYSEEKAAEVSYEPEWIKKPKDKSTFLDELNKPWRKPGEALPPHNPGPEHKCPECDAWREKESKLIQSGLKENYDALLNDLKEEYKLHYEQGNYPWAERLQRKITDMEKAITEKFPKESAKVCPTCSEPHKSDIIKELDPNVKELPATEYKPEDLVGLPKEKQSAQLEHHDPMGHGLGDLYILPNSPEEAKKICEWLKSIDHAFHWSSADVEGHPWYGKAFIEVPFGMGLEPKMREYFANTPMHTKNVEEIMSKKAESGTEHLTVTETTPAENSGSDAPEGKDGKSEYMDQWSNPDGRDLDKESWNNGILENSRYGKFYLHNDGSVEQFSGAFAGWKQPLRAVRKRNVKSVDQLIQVINTHVVQVQATPKQASLNKNAIEVNVFKRIWEVIPEWAEGGVFKGYLVKDDLGRKVMHIAPQGNKQMNTEQLEFAIGTELTRGLKQGKLTERIAMLPEGTKVYVLAQDRAKKRVKIACMEQNVRAWVPETKIKIEALESQSVRHGEHTDKVLGQTGSETLLDCVEGGPVWVSAKDLLDANRPPATPEALTSIEEEASEKGRKPSSLVHKEKVDELKNKELEKQVCYNCQSNPKLDCKECGGTGWVEKEALRIQLPSLLPDQRAHINASTKKKAEVVNSEELDMYTENERDLYDQFLANVDIIKEMLRDNTYDPKQAMQYWIEWYTQGAQKYQREFKGSTISPNAIQEAAAKQEPYVKQQVLDGEYTDPDSAQENINKLPTMDVEQAKDDLLNQLAKETDPERKKVLEQKYKRLSMNSLKQSRLSDEITFPCSYCKGTGKVKGKECFTCEGKGKITEPNPATQSAESSLNKLAIIVEENGKWCVRSPKNKSWNGGCFKSRAAAEKRLAEVERIKHMKGVKVRPFSKKAEVLTDPYQALTQQISDMRTRMEQVQQRLESSPLPKTADAEIIKEELTPTQILEDIEMGLALLENKISDNEIDGEINPAIEGMEALLESIESKFGLEEKPVEKKEEIIEINAAVVPNPALGQPVSSTPAVRPTQPTDEDNLESPVQAPTSALPSGQKWVFDPVNKKYIVMTDPNAIPGKTI